ncbi:MAG: cytochrome c oxidase assembly protein [Caulobacteraceae bacterium]|nr:cytochrome c oxidase assembly protein [Caulobacteraceae bacterium]
MSSIPASRTSSRRNTRVALWCVAVLIAMTAAGFAAVPLYRAFCQSTGFGGTISRATRGPMGAPLAQTVRISFDANVRGLPWRFTPDQTRQSLHIGATGLAFFTVTNPSDRPWTGRAVYNVTPDQAGAYFHKLQCFCFSSQTIPAHATVRFPVVYFVDPQFAADPDTKDFSDVTLSYTFYPAAGS